MRKLLDRFCKTQEIGGPNYMLRWFLLVVPFFGEVYLHRFAGPDSNRLPHDHPWLFNVTIVLRGGYLEELPSWPSEFETEHHYKERKAGRLYIRFGRAVHTIPEIVPGTITLFFGFFRWRDWGFYDEDGVFIDHNTYKRGLKK